MELLIVVAVITIITAFLLFNQSRFNSSTLLRSLGYSVALSIRQAQLYGTSVRGFVQVGGVTFAPGYGVQFSSGDLSRYYLFADLNNNGALDTSPVDERLSITGSSLITIGKGYRLSRFCGIRSSGAQDCYPAGISGGVALSSLTVFFKRPNADAMFTSSACALGCTPAYTGAYIDVQSAAGTAARTVKVTNTGQIVVCQLNEDPLTC